MIKINKRIGSPSVSFTPNRYQTVVKQWKQGIYRELIEMMKTATLDSHVAGCLIGRKAGFQKDFNIIPYSDTDPDKERAEWIRSVLNNLNMRALFKSIHEAALFKFSVIDFEWEVIDQKQVPVNFKKFDQKYFRYDPKDNYKLKIDHGRNLEDIPGDVLVCETDEVPVMFPVLRDYILKEFGLESWASFIETFGEPWIIGKYPPGSQQDVKDELKAGLTALAQSSRGIMPDTTEIEIKETSKGTGDHKDFREVCDTGISISILGHENAVQQSKGLQIGENIGSYKVKREIAVDDMFFIDPNVQKIIRNIIDRNFGDGKYPKFQLDKSEPVNKKEMLDILDTAFRHGLKISPDEYRKLGLFVYDDQEPLEKPPSIFP